MIMKIDILDKAISKARLKSKQGKKEIVILLDPAGNKFTQPKARKFSQLDHLILVCGHYEGVDFRISKFVDETVSIGNYVLTGGELPALIIADAVTRLIPGVLTSKEATILESYTFGNFLEAPQYTRPPDYKGLKVPDILLCGNHKEIEKWRERESIIRTKNREKG